MTLETFAFPSNELKTCIDSSGTCSMSHKPLSFVLNLSDWPLREVSHTDRYLVENAPNNSIRMIANEIRMLRRSSID